MDYSEYVGKEIRLIEMPNDPCPIPAGTTGRISSVVDTNDGHYSIAVDWDIDRSLTLVVPPDRFELTGR